jgi:hypothetical protein
MYIETVKPSAQEIMCQTDIRLRVIQREIEEISESIYDEVTNGDAVLNEQAEEVMEIANAILDHIDRLREYVKG